MDTNRLKKFATEARNKLKAGIAAKIITLGFDRNGNVPEHMHPQLMQGGTLWNGQLQTEGFYYQWKALYDRIQKKGIKEVYEEAAYTWFNRLVAIRILMKNQLIEPVLEYVDTARTPRIVDEARMGRMPQMSEQQRKLLMELLDDDSRTTEQFAILVSAFCHQNAILYRCFGALADYTELLLPNDILTEGGFIDLLNHTEFITDEEFRSPELIGWLYQFYISERKDEVFAKKGKFEADEIPAATQIFTPNWIVKYMVQNTVGRIYLDNHSTAASEFKPKWKYLVEPSEPTPKESIYKYKELTDLLVGDLACGSGHILNECFDILYDLYIYEGYSRREAIENIFTKNLRGVDLDTRAKQLAMFALMLKACQKDASFADAHVLPHVLSMPTPIPQEEVPSRLQQFFRETPSRQQLSDLSDAFELMQDAESLGSIMKFDLADSTLLAIRQALDYWHSQQFVPEEIEGIIPAMELILTLTDKYAALVMNPPYMGLANMNECLSRYCFANYSEGKQDLATVFVQMMPTRLKENGNYSFIIPPSWLCNSTFEGLRRKILNNNSILSLLNLSRGIFGADFGSSTCVISNSVREGNKGTFFRLVNRTFQEFEQEHLRILFRKSLEDHSFRFDFESYTKNQNTFESTQNGIKVYFDKFPQSNFLKLRGCPITSFWISERMVDVMMNPPVADYAELKKGMDTGKNELFIREWYELDNNYITYDSTSGKDCIWVPYRKGGTTRKWYGNNDYVINWRNQGEEVINFPKSNIRNKDFYFKEAFSWSLLSTNGLSCRYYKSGGIFDANAPSLFSEKQLKYLLGLFNTKMCNIFLKVINPTLAFQKGDMEKVPFIDNNTNDIHNRVDECIIISQNDWDSHETSWDFEANPLVALRNEKVAQGNLDSSFRLSDFVEEFETQWTERFKQLHENEEELNRQFIEIYGLQDELTPEVPMDEITILQQGEINIENYEIEWHTDVLMKQLISYAVGVWMGRYCLNKKGLHIAHPQPTAQELQEYWYGGVQVYIDDDGLIPILPQSSPFDDNLVSRIADFVRITFGEDNLTENLNYIEQQLGQTIEQYLLKDFWKDHKKMYQNRPIYWLFSSKKGAFKCLAYMHRMDAYTAERVRSNYLLPYIEYLQNQIADLENRASSLSTAENRKLQNLQKILDECREYHERLQVIAEQAIAFDLDDGVLVNYAKFGDILAKLK